ncbi:MAG: RNA polymerase sigma-54 factor [Nitrospirae bacterium GWC2_56_14]|nr:MAG: RNA polymerase sigma-54 factor [Nitrospirae bacterium GWC2_56_14]
MEARLELKLSQKLIMTPQLQQAIKLLQLSRLELQQSVSQELLENPVLEELPQEAADEGDEAEGEAAPEGTQEKLPDSPPEPEVTGELKSDLELGPQWDEYLNEMGDGRDYGNAEADDKELPSYDQTLTRLPSLSDHLMWQLRLSTSEPSLVKGGEWIVGNLDDDGYLRSPLEELAQQSGVSPSEMAQALELVQSFDPLGIAARTLQECLLIQVRQLDLLGTIVEKIVQGHLEDLEKRRYQNIAKVLNVTIQDVMEAAQIIIHDLEPKPGRPYIVADTHYVVPDVYVFKVEDHYVIQLNDEGLPRVRINPYYRKLLSRKDSVDKVTKEYIEDRMRSAQWLIKGMEQRNKTIYKVAESIVKFQGEFLDQGISQLKPMVLKDVAEDIAMHESTISRVTTSKHMHTPQGIFPMKFFFTTGFADGSGAEVSSLTVKDVIQKMVKDEDPAAPLKDQQIVDVLKARGIDIARRTVAKYREELRIPPTSVRKRLS